MCVCVCTATFFVVISRLIKLLQRNRCIFLFFLNFWLFITGQPKNRTNNSNNFISTIIPFQLTNEVMKNFTLWFYLAMILNALSFLNNLNNQQCQKLFFTLCHKTVCWVEILFNRPTPIDSSSNNEMAFMYASDYERIFNPCDAIVSELL